MRRLILACLAGATVAAPLALPASAADLPARRAPVVAPPPPPTFTWTGFYFGVNAGYGFDTRTNLNAFGDGNNANAVGILRPPSVQLRPDGFVGGAQIGYNYQLSDILGGGVGAGAVIGVEADAAYDSGRQTADAVLVGGFDNVVHTRIDFLGTARGRLGYAFDRVMVYGTGGFAYADTRQSSTFYSVGVPNYFGARSGFNTGYVYGGGIEYALPTTSVLNFFHSSAVTIKGEILHYQLGTRTFALPSTAAGFGGAYTQTASTNGNVARVGLNFKFGAPVATPVVARY